MKGRRYLAVLIVKGASVAALFAVQVVIARNATDESEYGFFTFLISILNLLSFVAIWGLDKFLVREVSVEVEGGRYSRAWAQIYCARRVIWVNLLFAGPLLAAILAWARPGRFSWILVLSLWLLLVAMCFARSGAAVIRAMHKVVASEVVLNLVRPLALCLGVLLYAWGGGSLTAEKFIFAAASAFALTALLAAFFSRRVVAPIGGVASASSVGTRDFYRSSFPYMLIGIGLPLLANLDVILLGVLSTNQEVAMYGASARLVGLSAVGLTAVNLLIAPRLPVLFQQKRFGEMQAMLRRNNIVIFLLTIVPVGVLVGAGGFILSVFGAEYSAGVGILHILLIGQAVNVFVGPVNLVCMMAHQHRAASVVTVFACVLEATLCYILIPGRGAQGAAWANTSALIFLNLALAFIVWHKVQVNPTLTNTIFGKR